MLLKGYSLTISDDSNMQYHLLIFSILLTYDWGWMSPWQRTVTNRGSSGSRPRWRSCSNISLTYLQCVWLSRMKGIWWAALFRILLLQLTDKLEFLYLLLLGWLWWGKILVTVSLEGKTKPLVPQRKTVKEAKHREMFYQINRMHHFKHNVWSLQFFALAVSICFNVQFKYMNFMYSQTSIMRTSLVQIFSLSRLTSLVPVFHEN